MSSGVSVEEFLASLSPEARAMTQRLRRVIREVSPAVQERAERETRSLRYSRPRAGDVLHLAPDGNDILLCFEHSHGLPDPRGLLSGDGTGKGEVRLTASGAFDEPYFRCLLEAALTPARG